MAENENSSAPTDADDLENNVQTDPISQNTGEVQVNGPEKKDKATTKYSINKVQIKKIKPPVYKQTEKDSKYATSVPKLKSKLADYTPMPYAFRVASPTTFPVRFQNLQARSPPFYILLDHTIAVIWLLFANKEYDCPLGITQLQWALAFLKTIRSREGDYPKDVGTCIDAIEEILINYYIELSKDLGSVEKLDDSIHYADGAFGSQTMVSMEMPFSLNYAEMIEKWSGHYGDQVQKTVSITSQEAEQQLENIKKAAGVDSIEKLDTVSKDKAINVLRSLKMGQVDKIREELRQLRKIEDSLKDIDRNFDGYLEDDMEILTGGGA